MKAGSLVFIVAGIVLFSMEGQPPLARVRPAAPGISIPVGTYRYHQGDPSTAAPVVTVQCNAGVWSTANQVRLIIPSGLNIQWDTSVTSITAGGAVPSRLSGTVSYANNNQTAIVGVASNFSPGDSATISGLRFTGFGAPSSGTLGAAAFGSNTTVDFSDTNGNTITIVGNPTLSSSSQTLSPPGPDAASVMTITDSTTPGIWSLYGLRIIIPAGLNAQWDTTVHNGGQGLAIGGPQAAFVGPDGSGNIVTYPSPTVARINVTSDFPASGMITVSGLKFTGMTTDAGPVSLYLDTNGTLVNHANDSGTKTVLGVPSMASASSPLYTVGDPSTLTPAFNIAASPGVPSKISTANGIQLLIPATLHMSWDQTIQKITDGLSFGGSAAGSVGPNGAGNIVTYPNAQTALINVTTNFATAATLTVQGLKFTSFTAASAPQSLSMNTGAAVVSDSQTYGIGAPAITDASSAPGQVFTVNANPLATQPCADLTVSDDPGGLNRIKAANGIRIRIPGTPTLTWDTSVSSVTFPAGTAAGHMAGGVTYEDSNRTAVIAVASDFSGAGQTVTLHGLGFQNLSAPLAPISLQLGVNGPLSLSGTICANDNRIIAIGGVPSLNSAANQAFTVNDPVTLASILTVTDSAGFPSIVTSKGITLKIPAGFTMSWDTAIQKTTDGLSFGGTASGKVGPNGAGNIVTYPNAQTALINVTTNFSAGDTLVVTGLKFQSFTAPHALGSLELLVDPLGSPVPDTQTIGIGQPTIGLSASQTFGTGDPSTILNTLTIHEDPNVPRIQSTTQIRIHIPPALSMSFDTTVQKTADGLSFGGTASGKVGPDGSGNIVTYPSAQIALINVTSSFSANDTLTIAGLKATNFTAVSGPLGLSLEVNNLGTFSSTTPETITIGARAKLLSVTTGDANGNGSIDRLVLTFDKAIKTGTASSSTGLGFAVQSPSYQVATASVSGAVVTLVLVERGIPDTGVTPVLSYDATKGDLQDTTGLTVASIAGVVAQDGAPAVVTGITVSDSNANGHLNTVTITWSESLLPGQENIADWKMIDADGSTNLLAGATMAISGSSIIFTLSDSVGTDGTPKFLYTPTGLPILKDLTGNTSIAQTNARTPVASAGTDFFTPPSKITLDATASSDPNGEALTYAWVQTGGSPVWTLDNPAAARPSFLGTTNGVYTFQVTVSDALLSSTATVHVTIIKVPPGADAGSSQTIIPGEFPVFLEALGSSDANGSPLSFTWTQTGGAPAIPDPPTPDPGVPGVAYFTAPSPTLSTTSPNNILTFQVAVSDGTNVTTDQVLIRLNSATQLAPTANAGPNQVVTVGSPVQLDGSLSLDPQGLALTYSWSSPFALPAGEASKVNPTFVPPRPGIYAFNLTVISSAGLASLPSAVQILAQAPADQAPVAVAQRSLPAGEIAVGDLVVLDGSASSDPEGAPITYAWTQVAGAKVILSNPGSSQSSFTPVIPGTYTFQLVVGDGANLSFPSLVSLTVKALPSSTTWTTTLGYGPGITNGRIGLSAGTVSLTATTSDNSPSNFWFFYWSQTGGPTLTLTPNLFFASPTTFTFTPTQPGYYTFKVSATTLAWAGTDGVSIRAYDTIGVMVDDDVSVPVHYVPTAMPSGPSTTVAGQPVTLNAGWSVLSGAPNGPIRAFWTQITGPPVVLSDPESLAPTFTPVGAGTYTFQLTVADNATQSPPATLSLTVTPPPSAAPAGGGSGGGCGFSGAESIGVLAILMAARMVLRRFRPGP